MSSQIKKGVFAGIAGLALFGGGVMLGHRMLKVKKDDHEDSFYKDTIVNDFEYHRPTKIVFGKDCVKKSLSKLLKENNVNTVLFTYGRGSIKKSGLYDQVIKILEECNIKVIELGNIKPNPTIKSVREGIKKVKENDVDFILAVGGGSTIDCSKGIAAGSCLEEDDGMEAWDLFKDTTNMPTIKRAIPLGCILTLSATGTEMNNGCVVSNEEVKEKKWFNSNHLFPKFSLLDPQNTYTVNKKQTIAGSMDIISHFLEQYFSRETNFISDKLIEQGMRTVVKYTPLALKEPENYSARSNIMWAGTFALGGYPSAGKIDEEWGTHWMEHELSAMYTDFTHGIGLAIVTIGWLKYHVKEEYKKICMFGNKVFGLLNTGCKKRDEWNVKNALMVIDFFENWLKENGCPVRITEVVPDFKEELCEELAERCIKANKAIGVNKKLGKEAALEIFKSRV